jgi:catechol 2,3-dioxygenase-like lactoylglutathione lyase family enzyme
MARGIDHIVHVVPNLEKASAIYERLGFQVGVENVHPWGTHNRLVQLPHCYIELLSIPEPEKLSKQPQRSHPFEKFNATFLAECGQGLSFLVLQGADTNAEKVAFDKAGFGGFEVMDFVRKGRCVDGSEVEVGFSLAFARDPKSPHAGFFTCLHKTPGGIWSPDLQRHKNGAKGITGAVLVAENPSDHHIFLEAFSGARDLHATSLGLRIETPQGEILVYDSRAFKDSFGAEPPRDEGMRLAAIIFRVQNLAAARMLLRANGFNTRELHNRLIVGPEVSMGAVIALETT